MATREDMEAELAGLNARLSEGLVRVSKGDRSAQYDLTALRNRRDELRNELSNASPAPMVRRVYLRTC